MILLALVWSLLVPGTVTDLRVSAVTDTSVVLTWTEVASGNTTVAKYLIRYNFDSLRPVLGDSRRDSGRVRAVRKTVTPGRNL